MDKEVMYMHLHERGAEIAAPIITRNPNLLSLHGEMMSKGNKEGARRLVAVITLAEQLAKGEIGIEQSNLALSEINSAKSK